MYIAFAGIKGGAGKTVLALHVAYYLSHKAKTALIDSDSLKGATHWAERSDGVLDLPIYTEKQAPRISSQFEHLIFDCPGRASREELKDLAQACDWLICPAPVDALNIDAAISLGAVMQELKISNYHIVLNRAPQTPTPRAANEARDVLSAANIPVLKTVVHDAAAFKHAGLAGLTVDKLPAHIAVSSASAWEDITNLAKEIIKL